MQELRSEIIGDRRVCLVAQAGDYYAVTIAVRGPTGWYEASYCLCPHCRSPRVRRREHAGTGRAE